MSATKKPSDDHEFCLVSFKNGATVISQSIEKLIFFKCVWPMRLLSSWRKYINDRIQSNVTINTKQFWIQIRVLISPYCVFLSESIHSASFCSSAFSCSWTLRVLSPFSGLRRCSGKIFLVPLDLVDPCPMKDLSLLEIRPDTGLPKSCARGQGQWYTMPDTRLPQSRARGGAGAIIEVIRLFGQEQWGQKPEKKQKSQVWPTDRPTNQWTDKVGCRVA